jgi:hypothetical protein
MKKSGPGLKIFVLFLIAGLFAACAGCAPKKEPLKTSGIIAYVCDGGLALYDAETKTSRLLVAGAHIQNVLFSPDRRYIFYNDSSDLFCFDRETGKRGLVAADSKAVSFLNGRLVTISKTYGIRLCDYEAGGSSTLVEKPDNGYIGHVLPSNDGSRLAYTVLYDDAGVTLTRALCVTVPGASDVISYAPIQIGGNLLAMPKPIAWTPDDSALIFSYGPEGKKAQLYSFQIVDGEPVAFAKKTLNMPAAARFEVSGDKTTAAATLTPIPGEDSVTIARINLAEEKYEFLPYGGLDIAGFDISADGSKIVFARASEEVYGGVFLYQNNKTLHICGDQQTRCCYPLFSDNDEWIYSVTPEENITLTLYRSQSNTAGASAVLSGIKMPEGGISESCLQMFDIAD